MNYEKINIEDETIYLKKGLFGWNTIAPYKIDGKINWKNLLVGKSWWNLAITIFIVMIIIGCIYEYSTAVRIANDCLKNCNFVLIP